MALHILSGVMGSGKSFEAIKEKLLPAVAAGRRVVTNIDGVNAEAIAKHLKLEAAVVASRLVIVDYERPAQPGFYYAPESPDSVVQPGDLLLLDECWRYFPRTAKVPEDAMHFVRMHRHYVSKTTNLSCEIVFINQTLSGLHRDIATVAEVEYRCRKLKVLGRPQNYQVFVYEGGERKSSHRFLRKYDPAIFPLYKSYAGAAGVEVLDKRQSALNTPFFKFVLPAFLIVMPFAGWHVYKSMSTGFGQIRTAEAVSTTAAAAQPAVPGPVGTPGSAPAPAGAIPGAPAGEWRLVATHKRGELLVATVVSSSGLYRTFPAVQLFEQGPDLAVAPPALQPGYVSPYTGSLTVITRKDR